MIHMEVSKWLYSTDFKTFLHEIEKEVIGQPNLSIFCANVYSYIQNIAIGNNSKNHTIIAAPSGSGKTQTYRAIRDYFRVHIPSLPVYIYDLSNLTPSGYKGSDTAEIVAPFFNMSSKAPAGIVFLDEFDKKLIPSIASGGVNVSLEAQNCILTLIEGGNVYRKDGRGISTENILFVGLGSFDFFREKREKTKNAIGFGNSESEDSKDHYKFIAREDMVELGGSNELLGRFPLIVNYEKLSEKAIDAIIDKYLEEKSMHYDCSLEFSGKFVDELKESANSNFGCRLIDSKITTAIIQIYTKALMNKEEGCELEISVEDCNGGTYKWVPYQTALRNNLDDRWVKYMADSIYGDDDSTDPDEFFCNDEEDDESDEE